MLLHLTPAVKLSQPILINQVGNNDATILSDLMYFKIKEYVINVF